MIMVYAGRAGGWGGRSALNDCFMAFLGLYPRLTDQGIRLSPAYDMNPSVDRTELTLAINEVETACDVSIAMEASKDYGLAAQQASNVLEEVQAAIRGWRHEADRFHIPKAEQDLMALAFEA